MVTKFLTVVLALVLNGRWDDTVASYMLWAIWKPQSYPFRIIYMLGPLSHWELILKFMLISFFRKKISSVNSQLSK